ASHSPRLLRLRHFVAGCLFAEALKGYGNSYAINIVFVALHMWENNGRIPLISKSPQIAVVLQKSTS
ncbi:MAG TPA: hypothetical protein PLJ52_03715, partial [Tenuifilaceae bacterium]|nr:hypothetical protein [Tenuifilaceae bacterium]